MRPYYRGPLKVIIRLFTGLIQLSILGARSSYTNPDIGDLTNIWSFGGLLLSLNILLPLTGDQDLGGLEDLGLILRALAVMVLMV